MKKTLLILVKNPFTSRDYERMGIDELRQRFSLLILDCSGWLMPQTQHSRKTSAQSCDEVVRIGSMDDFRQLINRIPMGFAIDYVGQFSVRAILMFHILKSKGFKLVVLDSGAYPVPAEWRRVTLSRENVIYAFRSKLLARVRSKLIRFLMLLVLPDQRPDIALIAGTSWRSDPRFVSAAVKIPAHSFDYEKYRCSKVSGYSNFPGRYAVYIDENLPSHEDNIELKYDNPVSSKLFFPSLRRFFDGFEKESGMPVRIAAYPSSSVQGEYKSEFGNRDFVQGQTAELIRGASVVFAHASTSISFAVLWRRPLIFLYSQELLNSWYMPWVIAMQRSLESPLVDIDDNFSGRASAYFDDAIKVSSYQSYESSFLRSSTAPDVNIWQILWEGIRTCHSNS